MLASSPPLGPSGQPPSLPVCGLSSASAGSSSHSTGVGGGGEEGLEEALVIVIDVNPTNWMEGLPNSSFAREGECSNNSTNSGSTSGRIRGSGGRGEKSNNSDNGNSSSSGNGGVALPYGGEEGDEGGGLPPPYLSLVAVVQSVLNYVTLFELGSALRNVAIIGMHANGSKILYSRYARNLLVEASKRHYLPSLSSGASSPGSAMSARKRGGAAVSVTELVRLLVQFAKQGSTTVGDSQLSTALAVAMCYTNRLRKQVSCTDGRILVLDAASEGSYSSQYVTLMNIAFTANKHNVLIDYCGLAASPAALPEHISEISHGVHLRFSTVWQTNKQMAKEAETGGEVVAVDCLTQFLIFHYLGGRRARRVMSSVSEKSRPNCAVCFCHHRPVDIAMVCSCCLAVYCSDRYSLSEGKERFSCDICRARFCRESLRTKLLTNVDVRTFP